MTTGERVPAAKVVEPVLRGLKVLRCRLGVAGGVGGVGGVGAVGAAHISRRTPRSRPAGSLAAAARRGGSRRADAWATQARARRRGRHRDARRELVAGSAAPDASEADIVAGASAGDAPPSTPCEPFAAHRRQPSRHGHDWRGRRGADRETRAVGRRTRGEGRNLALQPPQRERRRRPRQPGLRGARVRQHGRRALSGTADERPGRRSATRRARRGRRNQRVHDGRRARASRTVRTSRPPPPYFGAGLGP